MSGGAFSGFPDGTFTFLRDLAANNDRGWFAAHRGDYERYYLEPAVAFVEAIGPRLREISPAINFEPRINGSIFRINRDVRFSKDKSPYKPHLDLWFWEGERRGWGTPGFFFRLTAETLILGAGMHSFDRTFLEAYRAAVLDDTMGRALAAVITDVLRAGGYEIGGATRKGVPRGHDAGHERAGLLLHEGLWAERETAVPAEAHSAEFVGYCRGHFQAMAPISEWLLEVMAGVATR